MCAQPPLNIMILPFWWATLIPWNDQKQVVDYNKFLCHLLYIPLGLFFTLVFTMQNICYMPIAYFKHIFVLIQTLTNSDETMDDFGEKLQRAYTIIKFILFAPMILILAIPIDMIIFLKNLYS